MNLDSQATELLFGLLKGTDGAEQVQEEALLEALLVVGGLTARHPAKKFMYCSACQLTTQERCSYCLLPMCEAHVGRVKLQYTSRDVMVCTPCQARLWEMAKEEQSLWLA
jgi:hypothetical protein